MRAPATLLAINNVTNNATLQAVHEDLSEKSSVEAIIDYMVRSNKSQLEKWDEVKDEYPNTAEPPLAQVMIGCGCDGQLAVAMRRILAEDARCNRSERLYPDIIFVSFGGFHTIMKGLNASGEYFVELLKDIWSSFRDSWGKVKWILFPTDPRQRELDYSWCLLANYAVAAMNLHQHQKRDVSEFMLERAREFPICALALLEIRFGTVLKLMHNSEKLGRKGCVETFFSAIRLIMPLFTVTHKSDYMFLCQDLLKWHHCASPAQRKIYEEFIFMQLTANESLIFHDTFVELSVMDTRIKLGKVHRKGMDIAMEVAAANIPISDGGNTAARSLHNKDAKSTSSKGCTKDTLSTDISCPYYKVAEKYQEMRIWTPDVPPIIKGNQAGTTIEYKDYILEVPGGGELPSRILSSITNLGRERTRDYFFEYYINNYGEVKKSDKIVDLSKINMTVDGIKETGSAPNPLHADLSKGL